MVNTIVIDTSSLINFTKFYYFDKYNEKTIYTTLINFLISKIKSNEIKVIDKVYKEWFETRYNKEIRDEIKINIVKTEFLIPDVQELIENYKDHENIRLLNWSSEQIDLELDNYESGKIADLYLVAFCKYLKNHGEKSILITEETRKNDGKIIKKIPTICRTEGIRYENLPYSLFEIYKNELNFNLSVN
jgi:hypothetical protein